MERDAFRLSTEKPSSNSQDIEAALSLAATLNPGETFRAFKNVEQPKTQTGVSKNNVPPIPPKTERTNIGPPETYGFDTENKALGTQPVGGGGDLQHPFQILDSSDSSTAYCNVRYGTIMDIAPTDVATNLALTDSATNYVYIYCTLDVPGDITAADIDVNTTGLPANSDDSAYILIGNVVMAGGVVTTINQAVTHSLRFAACGRTNDGAEPPVLTNRGSYEFWAV